MEHAFLDRLFKPALVVILLLAAIGFFSLSSEHKARVGHFMVRLVNEGPFDVFEPETPEVPEPAPKSITEPKK